MSCHLKTDELDQIKPPPFIDTSTTTNTSTVPIRQLPESLCSPRRLFLYGAKTIGICTAGSLNLLRVTTHSRAQIRSLATYDTCRNIETVDQVVHGRRHGWLAVALTDKTDGGQAKILGRAANNRGATGERGNRPQSHKKKVPHRCYPSHQVDCCEKNEFPPAYKTC